MRIALHGLAAAAVLVASLVLACPAHAAEVDLLVGRSFTTHHLWTTVGFANFTTCSDNNTRFRIQPVATLGVVVRRSTHRFDLHHNVYVGGAGARFNHIWHGLFGSFQLGVAGGRTQALSSAEQFISSLGWQGQHWMIMVRHISDGGFFTGRNLGETMFLVGVKF